jgi:hypothetical protein
MRDAPKEFWLICALSLVGYVLQEYVIGGRLGTAIGTGIGIAVLIILWRPALRDR